MKRLGESIRRRLNTWDEICVDENARLRTNLLIFTFVVTVLYLSMIIVDTLVNQWEMLFFASIFFLGAFFLFLRQVTLPRYSPVIAWLFGLLAMGMSALFLYSGTMGGYSFIWIFLVPHIGAMVLRLRQSILFSTLLLALTVVLLHTPLRFHFWVQYELAFRVMFPAALFAVSLCIYLGEYVRLRIQEKLKLTAAELESFAFADPLTHAWNRRALAAQFGQPDSNAFGLSFAVLDLDYFKAVNDEYGHFVGDAMLCHTVNVVQQCLQPGWLLYRWGGEEFLLVAKTRDEQAFTAVLQTVCETLGQTPLETEHGPVGATLSIGGVVAPAQSSIQEAIKMADTALYTAQTGGRHRVCMHSPAV